ncbi:MAG: thymidylate kinase [Clostridiales bacterium]|uniref:dTMP kinase n=1 Tax=Clostridium sp. N3C TaxID=1776758 RepID=UPI00092DFDE9|nr:thymidylate kinase [Clostridium sp. N3C]NLZ48117.1 thymidylate kinase [Clostridiales bacterium]SCN23191.1 Thymidylate kinase [Clostridium sp. N3C]
MKGKLIIIDGSDGSGKATQSLKLFHRLQQEGYKVKKVEFPDYDSDSSALIKMYLNGSFGSDPNAVNPYVASSFYAVDRYASYVMKWKDFYEEGGIILSDRYTTSNMVHQAAKIEDDQEKEKFLNWLWDYEFNLFGLPVPDAVVFLDVPAEYSRKLMEERLNKFTGEDKKDIHESNIDFLQNSYNNAKKIAEKYKWIRINCVKNNTMYSIDEIHEKIYENLRKILEK